MVDGRECVITVIRDDGLGPDNPTFTFDNRRWKIPSDGLENFGGVAYEVSTEAYAQYDGSYLLNERIPERERTITAEAAIAPAKARAEAEAFFIPRREYEVHCTYLGRTRYFRGRQYALDISVGNVWSRPVLTWTCLALEPMWMSEEERGFDMAEAYGCFGFPFMSLAEPYTVDPDGGEFYPDRKVDAIVRGVVFGYLAHEIDMQNSGSATAYPRFVCAASGRVSNPRITITDSSGATVCEVGVELEMDDGDELVIDFSERPTLIELNGENASNLVAPGSTLTAGIEVGRFVLGWSADFGDAALSIRPTIRERFAGI